MHSQESGRRRGGGSKPDPLAFFPGVCSGGYLFSSGGPTPTTPPPRQFLPCLWTTNIFKIAVILNLKNHIWSRDCHRVPNRHLYTKFHQNRMTFRWDMAILWLQYGGVRHVELSKVRVYVTWPLRPRYSTYCAKFHWNGQKRFLKWRPSAMLNFRVQ